MRVLIISAEVWRDDTNGGNVLSNLFSNSGYEFAQIFCNPGEPQNKLCKEYYQMTDSMMISSILKKGKTGMRLSYCDYPNGNSDRQVAERENKQFYSFFRKYRFEIFYVIRSIIWKLANWKTNELVDFITDFNPDIVFAPCYASHELLALDRFVKRVTNVPVVSYISDDNYGLMQFRMDPVYWINRFVLRKNIRRTFEIYDLVYTMTDEQKREYEKALHCNMKVLKKGGDFTNVPIKESVNSPIRMIYAGGIYCGRWRTLARVAKELRSINADSIKIVLDIYTGNSLSEKQRVLLDDGVNSIVHNIIPLDKLREQYNSSDIALHVESFDIKNRLLTRLSFSTKIIDCLASGCAVMAICWKKQAGYMYLKKNRVAICIDNINDIGNAISKCIQEPDILLDYASRAQMFGQNNHQVEEITKSFRDDLEGLVKQ